MEVTFYSDLRKYAQNRLEEIVDNDTEDNVKEMQPLKVSLINISIFCSNMIIKKEGKQK